MGLGFGNHPQMAQHFSCFQARDVFWFSQNDDILHHDQYPNIWFAMMFHHCSTWRCYKYQWCLLSLMSCSEDRLSHGSIMFSELFPLRYPFCRAYSIFRQTHLEIWTCTRMDLSKNNEEWTKIWTQLRKGQFSQQKRGIEAWIRRISVFLSNKHVGWTLKPQKKMINYHLDFPHLRSLNSRAETPWKSIAWELSKLALKDRGASCWWDWMIAAYRFFFIWH